MSAGDRRLGLRAEAGIPEAERRRVGVRRARAGFTLIELIVVVAILVGLAGILVPVVSSEVATSKSGKALGDCNRIADAMVQFYRDTGVHPTGNQGALTYHFLFGSGSLPSSNDFASGTSESLDGFLSSNTYGGSLWKGPYLQTVGPDPWGRAYVVNVHGHFPGVSESVWILSSGPNGAIDTTPTATQPGGDDVAILVD